MNALSREMGYHDAITCNHMNISDDVMASNNVIGLDD
jgi:hypothetical protein